MDRTMRVTKEERKSNAKKWYGTFMGSNCPNQAVIIERNGSTTNPYVNRTQFKVVIGTGNDPIVIAESSTHGVEGCFMELIEFLCGGIRQTCYYEDGFAEFLQKTLKFRISYNDGTVMMWTR